MIPDELPHDPLPGPIAGRIAGYRGMRIAIGCSGHDVFRLDRPGAPTLYLKIAGPTMRRLLLDEKLRLEWLHPRLPVPRVIDCDHDADRSYLLLSEVRGIDASNRAHSHHLPDLIELLAEGLRMFHTLPLDSCPFDRTLTATLAEARRIMDEGREEEEKHSGTGVAALYATLLRDRPEQEDLVVTHGDYSLPNIIVQGGTVAGFIDCGRVGIADRYADLATAARSLAYNFGAEWVPALFDAYGLPKPDRRRIEYYTLLDELL